MSDERLYGAKAIAKFLGISERWFYVLKKRAEGTPYVCPVIIRGIGMGRRRTRQMLTCKSWIMKWYFQVNYVPGFIRHKRHSTQN